MRRLVVVNVVAGLSFAFGGGAAHAYSTKLHMITGHHIAEMLKNGCKLKVGGWNRVVDGLDLRAQIPGGGDVDKTATIDLSGAICDLITGARTRQHFLSGTTAPDTFPGMFGNTDPTHALTWNTAWQIPVLWQNAKKPEDKAFVLGWVVHFAGDLNAHGLANLHANGVWMANSDPGTVWKHIVTETYYADSMLPYPNGFNNTLVWPGDFVKRMFYNPESPIYKHLDYTWVRYVGESGQIGAVAKAFGAAYRALFLLWDFFAKNENIWEGRMKYYVDRKWKTFGDFVHWLFADQAYNWFKKKRVATKEAIDTWYEATHRAQQAVVADDDAVWDGKRMYAEGPKRDVYRSGGIGGIIDAYKYLGKALVEVFDPDPFTITYQNFPIGAAILDALDFLKEAAKKFVDFIVTPLKRLGRAVKEALLDPILDPFKEWLKREAMCTAMPKMCESIDGQKKAFRVEAGKLATYLNWPIYRNTITAAALMLEKMKALRPDSAGDESMSPAFGLPSGDFGCTGSCTGVYAANKALFMPMAGAYFKDCEIKRAFPDYCMAGSDARRTREQLRRVEAYRWLNEKFAGITNSAANVTEKGGVGFTCLTTAKGKDKACGARDTYGKKGTVLPYDDTPETLGEKVRYFFGRLYEQVAGRWEYSTHKISKSSEKFVVPADAVLNGQSVSYVNGKGEVSGVTAAGREAALCYGLMRFGRDTVAPEVPEPEKDHKDLNVKQAYQFSAMIGRVVDELEKLFGMTKDDVGKWIKKKCKESALKRLGVCGD